MNTQKQIAEVCDNIKHLLLDKNKKYGNSALEPVRVFSKATPIEQLLVRIDDKLSRISNGAGISATDEDVINDLIGYLVLLKIAKSNEKWDGTDIEPVIPIRPIWDTERKFNPLLNDSEWLDLHLSGDRFA